VRKATRGRASAEPDPSKIKESSTLTVVDIRASNSFDHLVGAAEQRRRHVEPERLGGLGVEHQLEFGRLLHRKVRGLLAPEDAVDVTGGEPVVPSIMAASALLSARSAANAVAPGRRKTKPAGFFADGLFNRIPSWIRIRPAGSR
jgi:hypothetical protein